MRRLSSGARETLAVHIRKEKIRAPTDEPVEDPRRGRDLHIEALLTEALGVLSPAGRQLLNDWLDRLATARSHP